MSTALLRLAAMTVFLLASATDSMKIDDTDRNNRLFQRDSAAATGTEELRCYCNLSECIINGYMCKSSGAGCFSELERSEIGLYVLKGIYGCLDLLPLNKSCDDILKTGPDVDPYHCCTQDMCNDNIAMSLGTNKYFSLPATLKEESGSTDPINDTRTVWLRRNTSVLSNTEMEWFETMTLFVPICGAVALLLLIFIAFKLLKSSNSLDDGSLVSKIRPNKMNYGFTILPNGGGAAGQDDLHRTSANGYHKCLLQSKMRPTDVYRPTTYVFAGVAPAEKNAANANANAANRIDLTKHSLIAPVNCHYEQPASPPPMYTALDTDSHNNNNNNNTQPGGRRI
ncbi:BMP and activin membrane-bound inhibitor homolog [Adelges cooleyi]|uniref:BMP and activin membrane-bound inhibitor homolog n=1 Tax=Adelges cooleyi TaxID=133065 RepID=UPI0021805190|nr:BMP and activin membrane-bound inhibitor homolog [Adelges cooleyi]